MRRKPTKNAKIAIVQWKEKTQTYYESEYICPCCGTTYINTLSKSNNMTRFKCDCGQEIIIKDKIVKIDI